MAGLGVVALVVALGALAALLIRDPDGPPARGRAGAGRPGRRGRRMPPPDWVREPPVGAAEAERRSLELLRSVINPDEWEMFRDLGFICVAGRRARRRPGDTTRPGAPVLPRYRYLVYPHLPVVALLPRSMAPVREYCVQFPDRASDGSDPVLPSGDDVLAKWMTLRADEDRLLAYANVCNAGCQIPLSQIERDLERLSRWQARRARRAGGGSLAGVLTTPLREAGRSRG